MMDLKELYQEVILDHSRHPRNFGPAEDATSEAQGNNPLCGDRVTVYLKMGGDVIEDVRFEGRGCAISTASASMMTELVKGKTETEARALFDQFRQLVTTDSDSDQDDSPELDKLVALSGVREFPTRVKCATLAWHTMAAALDRSAAQVTTE